MRLTVLGSSGTYPTLGHPASGYLVSHGDTRLVLDLGPGTHQAMLRECRRPDAVVLSHAHPDHCSDLFALFNSIRFGDTAEWGIPVYSPAGVSDRFAAFLGVGADHALFEVFSWDPVASGDRRVVGALTLEFGEAAHSVPAIATAVSDRVNRLVYSGDTGPGGDLERLAAGCDLLLCEATFQGEPDAARYPHHLFAVEAGQIAADASAGRLIVTHLGPTLDPRRSVEEAGSRFDGPVDHAVPGMEVDL